jgi:hypothetical protein
MIGPQLQGPVHPQPFGMPGFLQPPGPADPVQRLALMMALMVLGMPPVYSCNIPAGCGLPFVADMSEPRVCPPIGSETGIGISACEGRTGREAVGETACGALRGHAIVLILHVRTGWPGEEGQV